MKFFIIYPFWPSSSWYSSLRYFLFASPFPLPPAYVLDKENLLPKQCHFLAWAFDCNPAGFFFGDCQSPPQKH